MKLILKLQKYGMLYFIYKRLGVVMLHIFAQLLTQKSKVEMQALSYGTQDNSTFVINHIFVYVIDLVDIIEKFTLDKAMIVNAGSKSCLRY